MTAPTEPAAVTRLREMSEATLSFEVEWRKKEADGYRYGGDALENVEFGFHIAKEAAEPSRIACARAALALVRQWERATRHAANAEWHATSPDADPVNRERAPVLVAAHREAATLLLHAIEQAVRDV